MLAKATYIAHSGYSVSINGVFLLFDYYEGGIPEEELAGADKRYIFASHSHADHFNRAILKIPESHENTKVILSSDIRQGDIRLSRGDQYSDEVIKVSAFGSTDIGSSFVAELFGKSVFHAGDLNFWHWRSESTPAEVADAHVRFEEELDFIKEKYDGFDIAFFPVDPRLKGRFWEGAEIFLNRFDVKHFFCMHMWEHYDAGLKFMNQYSGSTDIHSPQNRGDVFEIDI